MFSKIIPSFFTIKEGSTFLTKPLFPQEREDVTALRCSEPLRYKVGGPSKFYARSCGMGPPKSLPFILSYCIGERHTILVRYNLSSFSASL